MKKGIAVLLTLWTLFFLPIFGNPGRASPVILRPSVYAGGYVLLEKEDRLKIAGENEHLSLSPASTTKIMTCLVVLEQADLNEDVVVSENASLTEGSSAYLRKGEHLTVKELLYCLMLASANDAATALAEHVAGSIEDFAAMMNEKARSLGMKNTHFTNPHGLDDEEHRTTAYDLAILACSALDNPDFAKIAATKYITVGKEESRRTLTNHNRLLFSLKGCIGVKTGYTMHSGRCLVSACRRNGTTLVCVTLNCRNDWESPTNLYAYGFDTVRRFFFEGVTLSLPMANAEQRKIEVYSEGLSLLGSSDSRVTSRIYAPECLYPPLSEGSVVGQVEVYLDGKLYRTLPLLSAEQVEEPPQPGLWRRLLLFLRSLFGLDG